MQENKVAFYYLFFVFVLFFQNVKGEKKLSQKN